MVSLRVHNCELVTQPIMASKREKNSQAWKTFDIEVRDCDNYEHGNNV